MGTSRQSQNVFQTTSHHVITQKTEAFSSIAAKAYDLDYLDVTNIGKFFTSEQTLTSLRYKKSNI